MVELAVPELEGVQVRYNDDTWELTGIVEVKQNGELIEARAKKPNRVRGSTGRLKFVLDTPPASLNPGNPGDFDCEITKGDGGHALTITRNGRPDRYSLEKLRYD